MNVPAGEERFKARQGGGGWVAVDSKGRAPPKKENREDEWEEVESKSRGTEIELRTPGSA